MPRPPSGPAGSSGRRRPASRASTARPDRSATCTRRRPRPGRRSTRRPRCRRRSRRRRPRRRSTSRSSSGCPDGRAALGEHVHPVQAVRRERAGRLLGDDTDGAARGTGRVRGACGRGRGHRRRAGARPARSGRAAAVVSLAPVALDAAAGEGQHTGPADQLQHPAAVEEGRQVEGQTPVVIVPVVVGGRLDVGGCGGHGSILLADAHRTLGGSWEAPGNGGAHPVLSGLVGPPVLLAPISSRTDMIRARLGRGQRRAGPPCSEP